MKEFLAKLAADFNTNLVVGDRYLMLLNGLSTTVVIAFGAAILGTVLG
ncbi:MAG: hypothetical protein GX858_06435, partial [Clostridiales bacterium]|nr:hypothetical protein [Clostridiales bacterium]